MTSQLIPKINIEDTYEIIDDLNTYEIINIPNSDIYTTLILSRKKLLNECKDCTLTLSNTKNTYSYFEIDNDDSISSMRSRRVPISVFENELSKSKLLCRTCYRQYILKKMKYQ